MAMSPTTPKSHDESHAVHQAVDKAKEMAKSASDAVSSAASSAGRTVDNLASSAGSGLKSVGDRIESALPKEGYVGAASHAVASGFQQTGQYLEQEKLSGMMEDVTDVIRRNPFPAILVGIGLGFIIGRTLRS